MILPRSLSSGKSPIVARRPGCRARAWLALLGLACSTAASADELFVLPPDRLDLPCPAADTFATLQAAFDAAAARPGADRIHLYPARYPTALARVVVEGVNRLEVLTDLDAACAIDSAVPAAVLDGSDLPALTAPGSAVESLWQLRNSELGVGNLHFEDAVDGGAITLDGSSLQLLGTRFASNSRVDRFGGSEERNDGGAIRMIGERGPDSLLVQLSEFIGNLSRKSGGAILCRGGSSDAPVASQLRIENGNLFQGNRAGNPDETFPELGRGGAIQLTGNCQLEIEGNDDAGEVELRDNRALGSGGAIGTSNSTAGATLSISGAVLEGNRARQGGAVFAGRRASILLVGVLARGNQAELDGGALAVLEPLQFATFATRFDSNEAGRDGGAVLLDRGELAAPTTANFDAGCDSRALAPDRFCAEFRDNRAEQGLGGAIRSHGLPVLLRQQAFLGNHALDAPVLYSDRLGAAETQPVLLLRAENLLLADSGFGGASRAHIQLGRAVPPMRAAVSFATVPEQDGNRLIEVIDTNPEHEIRARFNLLPDADADAFGPCNLPQSLAAPGRTARGSFRPRLGSAAIDVPPTAGCDPDAPANDLDGRRRDGVADWGAFEFAASDEAPLPPRVFGDGFED